MMQPSEERAAQDEVPVPTSDIPNVSNSASSTPASALEGTAIKILSFDDIMQIEDTKERTIDVPEWGGSVVIKPLTKNDQRVVRAASRRSGEMNIDEFETGIVSKGLVTPSVSFEQARMLGKKSSVAFDRVVEAIVGTAPQDAQIEEEEKKFLD